MDIAASLVRALELHRAGQRTEAEQLYRQVLTAAPATADAWHLYGQLAWQGQHRTEALALFDQAVALEPGAYPFRLSRATLLHCLNRQAEAEADYRAIVAIDSKVAEAHLGLAELVRRSGRLTEAEAELQLARQLVGGNANRWNAWGGEWESWGQWNEACRCYEEAVRIEPDFVAARSNLGNALKWLGLPAMALAHYEAALRLQPDAAEVLVNLGTALHDLDRFAEAAEHFQRALALNPELPEAYSNLGHTRELQGRYADALHEFEAAVARRPDFVQAHWNLALVLLVTGDWPRGWQEFEWRWRKPGHRLLKTDRPRWDGSPLAGRTILVYDEQGFGDTLQFVRFAPQVKQHGGVMILRSHEALVELLRRSPGVDRVVSREEPLPPHDVQIPLLSLPGLLGTRIDSVPAAVPYLVADPKRVEAWRGRLTGSGKLRVGIVWRGNPLHPFDRRRSIGLDHFEPLAKVEGVDLYSLQKDGSAEWQLTRLAGVDLAPELTDFDETAAVVSNLDLVVTCDTALAHLAGGLGKPVWLALSAAPDWRWLLVRRDTPWYPTMKLFRQQRLGHWDDVFVSLAGELRMLAQDQRTR